MIVRIRKFTADALFMSDYPLGKFLVRVHTRSEIDEMSPTERAARVWVELPPAITHTSTGREAAFYRNVEGSLRRIYPAQNRGIALTAAQPQLKHSSTTSFASLCV
jgi:hypothetical protein